MLGFRDQGNHYVVVYVYVRAFRGFLVSRFGFKIYRGLSLRDGIKKTPLYSSSLNAGVLGHFRGLPSCNRFNFINSDIGLNAFRDDVPVLYEMTKFEVVYIVRFSMGQDYQFLWARYTALRPRLWVFSRIRKLIAPTPKLYWTLTLDSRSRTLKPPLSQSLSLSLFNTVPVIYLAYINQARSCNTPTPLQMLLGAQASRPHLLPPHQPERDTGGRHVCRVQGLYIARWLDRRDHS